MKGKIKNEDGIYFNISCLTVLTTENEDEATRQSGQLSNPSGDAMDLVVNFLSRSLDGVGRRSGRTSHAVRMVGDGR